MLGYEQFNYSQHHRIITFYSLLLPIIHHVESCAKIYKTYKNVTTTTPIKSTVFLNVL